MEDGSSHSHVHEHSLILSTNLSVRKREEKGTEYRGRGGGCNGSLVFWWKMDHSASRFQYFELNEWNVPNSGFISMQREFEFIGARVIS